jgi:hypothetical protein
MRLLPYFYDSSPLFFAQAALTIWMLVDASRRRVEFYWYWLILFLQPIGAWAYFVLFKLRELRFGSGRMANVFTRPTPLVELRHRVEHAPTVTSRLELAERLVETGEFTEPVPLLEAVLAREPEHLRAMFLLAQARRGLGRPADAIPLYEQIVTRQPAWREYAAWYPLIACCSEAGDLPAAVTHCRGLARTMPSMEHTCLLAEQLVEAGESVEAKKTIQHALDEYRFSTGQARRRDGRWVGRAKRILKQIG